MSQSKRTWRRRIGRVTVYLRGSRYWIYYRQGKQVRRPVGTSKEEALALAPKINAQLAEGAPTATLSTASTVGSTWPNSTRTADNHVALIASRHKEDGSLAPMLPPGLL